ncbi:hypothetical protein FQZ97_772570 [compost metagenome]
MDATVLKRWWHGLLAMGLLVLLTGCASGPKLVPHAFSFNGLNDKWADSVDLLAYAYGDGYHMVREDLDQPSSSLYAGKTSLPPGTGVNGPMPVGEFLLVKWRVKTTGEVVEERVDLRDRLPRDMTDHELTFVIDGRQLYVYVVTPRRKKSFNEPPILKTWRSEFAHAYEIFPAMRKP